MRVLLVGALALLLVGCGDKVAIRYKTVYVPLAQSCVPAEWQGKATPTFVDTDERLLAADGPTRYGLTIEGRGQRDQYIKELQIVLKGCADVH